MKTLSVGEFKAKFSDVINGLLSGEEFTVTYGKRKEKVGIFMPYKKKNN